MTTTEFDAVKCPKWAPGDLIENSQFMESRPRITANAAIRLVQWNIERGYELAGIIEELQQLDADILCIQELDIACDRSANVDCLTEIARGLKMGYAFTPEFKELRSPVRSERDQGGGLHGNAIFSRFPFKNARVIKHTVQPVDWNKEGEWRREPREGARYAVAALVDVPEAPQPIQVYSCHLEVFCDIAGRVGQFADILHDATVCSAKNSSNNPAQIIAGDLNTMAHGIARFSPYYCGSSLMRFTTIGWSEPQWWQANVLCGEESPKLLRSWGISDEIADRCVNPGFEDPFDIDEDVTVINHCGWFSGKLDWILLRGPFQVVNQRLGNCDFALSDHMWLLIDVCPLAM